MSDNNLEDETKLLVDLSRIYPYFSVSALRKLMLQYNGDRNEIINHIESNFGPFFNNDINKINNNWCTPQASYNSPKASPQHKPKPKVTFSPFCVPRKKIEPPRKRHASAPHRILVLPPSKSVDSTNNDDQLSVSNLNLFSPDSLMGGDVEEFKKKCDASSIYLDDSYESQYLKLCSSFSRTMDEFEASQQIRHNQDYLHQQQQDLKHLQSVVGNLLNDYEQLTVSHRELTSMKEGELDEDYIRKFVNPDTSTSIT